MKMENYFNLKQADWVWWVGVIEARGDVSLTGRYQVRIFGYHTDDVEVLPTKDLPYATCVQPVTSASTSGIMETPNLLPGSTVVGFFADGKEGQMPIIMGSIAGKPAPGGGPGQEDAFNDPNKKYPRGMWEDTPEGYAGVGEPDISKLARDGDAEGHYSLITKRAEREIDVRTASAPSLQDDKIFDDKENVDYEGQMWEEPHARAQGPYKTFEKKEFEPKYWDALADLQAGGTGAPKEPGTYTSLYPFNKVKETEAGFTEEFDNTGKAERYAMYHPNGNFVEHQTDGTKVEKIKGDDYEIVVKDKNVLIRGSCNVTVMGDCKMLVQGDKYEEVEGDYFLTIFGDRITKINGNDMKSVITDQNYSIGGNRAVRVSLDDSSEIIGNQTQKVVKDKTETVTGRVTEDFTKQHNTKVGLTRGVKVAESYQILVGENFRTGVGGIYEVGSQGNMIMETKSDMDVDAAGTMTIDAPTMSIDGPAGNITSNDVTLHTHTHPTTSMDTGTGANSGAKNDSDAPNAPS